MVEKLKNFVENYENRESYKRNLVGVSQLSVFSSLIMAPSWFFDVKW